VLGLSTAGSDEDATAPHDFRNRFLRIDGFGSVLALPIH